MTELELKFRLPAAALPALRSALRAHGARRIRLQARYFDTADGLLARHCIALRLRLEGRRWVQTVKAAGDGAIHRLEHEVQVAGDAKKVPAIDVGRHADSEAGQALQAVLLRAPGVLLIERHATDVWRLYGLVDAAGTQVEAALDVGSARSGSRSSPIVELELEHKGGPVQGLFDLATAWVRHGGLWQSTITKAQRGQRLLVEAGDAADLPAVTQISTAAAFPAGPNGAALMRALLQSTLGPVLAHASEVAEGVDDAEEVHQLRVGLRRLRTVLRELAPLSPALQPGWDGALADCFAQLGLQRDQQAVAAAVQPLLAAAGAPLLAWDAGAAGDPAAAVRAPAFQTTLLAIQALAHAGDDRFADLAPKQVLQAVALRLDRLHRRLARHGRHFETLPLARQHRLRKQLKRLRYLAELTAPLWPRKQQRGCLKRLRSAQEALGAHNDVAVAAGAFRAAADAQPAAWFAAGYLQAHLAVTARAARRALVEVADGGRFWR